MPNSGTRGFKVGTLQLRDVAKARMLLIRQRKSCVCAADITDKQAFVRH
jgi:hypothetical protein